MNNEGGTKQVIYGGPIITMNEKQPFIEAVGLEGEKIVAVGKLDDVKNQMGNDYIELNLDGNSLLPGFIDSHIHPIMYMFFQFNIELLNVKSLKELENILKEAVKNKKTDELTLCLSFKEEDFTDPKERVLPTRKLLDKICPNHPIFILRYDGHIGIANSKALEFVGIDKNTKVPEGGEIRVDNDGELTGIVSESARSMFLSKVSLPDPHDIQDYAINSFTTLAKKGLTTLHGILHLGFGGEAGDLGAAEIHLMKSVQERIPQSWYSMVYATKPMKIKRIKKPPLHEEKSDSKFTLGCYKAFLDGTFGGRTACMFEPFSDQPDKKGFLMEDEEKFYAKMKIAHDLGLQIAIHVIGDKGARICVDLYKRLLSESPREDHRHRMEHASMLTPDVLKDMKNLGIIASCQPPFINSEYTWLEKTLGKERCKYTYPMKSIIESGVILASGSDCPVEDPDVILGLHALVNRNGFVPEQCISMMEALKSYTINGAYAAFQEEVKGSIENGKLADFVILDKNPLEVSKDNIKDLKIVKTIIRGEVVYDGSKNKQN